MVNTNKIRGLIAERRFQYRDVAAALNVTPETLANKLNNGKFYVDEAKVLVDFLGIDDPLSIFFASDVN